jgi:addiction module HigA family antidote
MAMKNPPHVGDLIRREVIEPLGLTVTEAAKVLGVGRQALSSLLNGKAVNGTESPDRVVRTFMHFQALSARGSRRNNF